MIRKLDRRSSQTDQPRRARLPLPSTVQTRRVLWFYAVPIVAMHFLALLALLPWYYSTTGLVVMLLGVLFFGQGINLCYHRLLAHRSFKTPRWVERFYVMVALCCMEDTPAKWVATHRVHHRHSDEREDPHSPLVNFFWGHFGWLMLWNSGTRSSSAFEKYARDLLQDPFYLRLEKSYLAVWIYLVHAGLFAAFGGIVGWFSGGASEAVRMAASLLVWGVVVRTVVVWHITWSVNSLTHLFGYRNYNTRENSRNNWLVALLAVGEGWHNNHHHDPAAASVQHRWWELDPTYYHIKLLEFFGLASDVIPPRHLRSGAKLERLAQAGEAVAPPSESVPSESVP